MHYAHSVNSSGNRHPLVDHLNAVAALARDHARNLGAQELAYYLGLWHDLGKFDSAFQEYLLACERDPAAHRRGPDHKAAGALLAEKHSGLAALLIHGHHGGLDSPALLKNWLADRRLNSTIEGAQQLASQALPDLEPAAQLPLPSHAISDARSAEMFLRLLFSAIVDADYLDTEAHFRATTSSARVTASLAGLLDAVNHHVDGLSRGQDGKVARVRRAVYESCLSAATGGPGVFRLAAPTGAGKTIASMAFALRHAAEHGHERVVVAVPFISITEQTADVYRSVFEMDGRENIVLEHHSGAYPESHGEDFAQAAVWSRLAAENWDAPVVVTTTVQLFESLFSNMPSRCRRLHRLARSVIIVDEAQALPPHLLRPILDVLRELTAHYGTTVVISTATQPAFEVLPEFLHVPATDILPDAPALFSALKRVDYEWLVDPPLDWAAVAEILRSTPQSLAVLNTKKDALALLDALADPLALHLSTLLCGAHRRDVLNEVKRRIATGKPCWLVTTQVVEAGVDLDFPLVLRAVAPLDSVIQAAGRCNREGRLDRGRVVVFRPAEGGMPPGAYTTGAGVTASLLGRGNLDPDDPAHASEYFRLLFGALGQQGLDRSKIQELREGLNYPRVREEFRMIDDDTESVAITTYGSATDRRLVRQTLDALAAGTPDARSFRRRLQPYLVSVRSREAERYRHTGLIAPIQPGIGEWLGKYHITRGLELSPPAPDALVI